MSRPSAEQGLQWIQQQIEKMGELRNANTRDPIFREWRQNTLTVLQRIWPGQAERFQRFRRVPFAPPSARATDQEARDCYERGFAEIRKLLMMWEAELKHLGTGGDDVEPDAKPGEAFLRTTAADQLLKPRVDERPADAPSLPPSRESLRPVSRGALRPEDEPERPPTRDPLRPGSPTVGGSLRGKPMGKFKRKEQLREMLGLNWSGDPAKSGEPQPPAPLKPARKPLKSAASPPAAVRGPAPPARRKVVEPARSMLAPDALGRSISDAIEESRVPTGPSQSPPVFAPPPEAASRAPSVAPLRVAPPPPAAAPPTVSTPPPVSMMPSAPPPPAASPGPLQIEPGFEGAMEDTPPTLAPEDVKLSPTLGGAPTKRPDAGNEFRALIGELERFGVPTGDLTRVSLGLAELSAVIDHGVITWVVMRDAMALVMTYPGLARRAVPMLLRHFEAAA